MRTPAALRSSTRRDRAASRSPPSAMSAHLMGKPVRSASAAARRPSINSPLGAWTARGCDRAADVRPGYDRADPWKRQRGHYGESDASQKQPACRHETRACDCRPYSDLLKIDNEQESTVRATAPCLSIVGHDHQVYALLFQGNLPHLERSTNTRDS